MIDSVKAGLGKLITRVKNNPFIKNILTLSAGVVVSQSVALLTTPVISRIYDPGVIGDFSIITSDSAIISVVVCLGLMSAVMVPKDDEKAKSLCRLLLGAIVFLSTVLLLVAIALSGVWRIFEVELNYTTACLMLYAYVVLTNISSLCYAYVNRQKMYKVLFWNPTLGTVTNAVISIFLGLLKCGLWGYALGNILASAFVTIHMLIHVNPFRQEKALQTRPIALLKEYRDFPLYQLPSDVIGAAASQIPIQLIKLYFGSAILGSYSMCMTILGLPSKFLAGPINRVYYREATEKYNNGESIGEFSLSILVTNIKIAIIPICLLMIFGEPLFSFVLGAKWRQAGTMASVLGAYQLVSFCNSCLNGKFIIIKRQRTILLINIVFTIVVFGTFYVTHLFGLDAISVLCFYAIFSAFVSMVDTTIFMYQAGVQIKRYLVFILKFLIAPITVSTMIRILAFGVYN